jgi:hypothetical protein
VNSNGALVAAVICCQQILHIAVGYGLALMGHPLPRWLQFIDCSDGCPIYWSIHHAKSIFGIAFAAMFLQSVFPIAGSINSLLNLQKE